MALTLSHPYNRICHIQHLILCFSLVFHVIQVNLLSKCCIEKVFDLLQTNGFKLNFFLIRNVTEKLWNFMFSLHYKCIENDLPQYLLVLQLNGVFWYNGKIFQCLYTMLIIFNQIIVIEGELSNIIWSTYTSYSNHLKIWAVSLRVLYV